MDFEIRLAETARDLDGVRTLWSQYWASFGLPPDFQGFADELRDLPGAYGSPGGLLWIAYGDQALAGTVALRRLSQPSAHPEAKPAGEAKRLYVAPDHRGHGLGRLLLARLIAGARSLGYRAIYGDSLPSMAAAQQMYRTAGFKEVDPYSASPTPGAVYFRLQLD